MSMHLPKDLEKELKETGLTYNEIREYDITPRKFRRLRNRLDLPIEDETIDSKGTLRFHLPRDYEYTPPQPENHTEMRRQTTKSKQTITKAANEYLRKLEEDAKTAHKTLDIKWPEMSHTEGKEDIVIHRTDDHFGEVSKDEHGNEIFNSEICERRVRTIFKHAHDAIDARREMGHDIENAHVLLGGDHVTNECIYEGQWQDIDQKIRDQLTQTASVYLGELLKLTTKVDKIQVVCQVGNHGDFNSTGSSNQANADDIFYVNLEMLVAQEAANRYNRANNYVDPDTGEITDPDNYVTAADVTPKMLDDHIGITFVRSDRGDFTNFTMRGHRAHLRHGHNVANHIGTNARRNTWRGFIHNYNVQIAYRGHYHEYRVETVDGVPVIMSPSIKPCGEYENSLSFFGDTIMGYVHGVNDQTPLAWKEYILFDAEQQ